MTTEAKTVRVRIAVAVDAFGSWNSSGWLCSRPEYDAEAMELARQMVDAGEVCYWLEADVPLPTTGVIEAKVTPA